LSEQWLIRVVSAIVTRFPICYLYTLKVRGDTTNREQTDTYQKMRFKSK